MNLKDLMNIRFLSKIFDITKDKILWNMLLKKYYNIEWDDNLYERFKSEYKQVKNNPGYIFYLIFLMSSGLQFSKIDKNSVLYIDYRLYNNINLKIELLQNFEHK